MPFTTIEMFKNLDVVKNNQISTDKITLISAYFLVETDVTIEKQHIVLYTLLQRLTNANKASINILWQSKGVW
jgi:type II secretory pathway component PulK